MNKSEFLTLSWIEQDLILSTAGNLIITWLQGNNKIDLYKVKELFVKITVEDDGTRKVEAGANYQDFKLFNRTVESA